MKLYHLELNAICILTQNLTVSSWNYTNFHKISSVIKELWHKTWHLPRKKIYDKVDDLPVITENNTQLNAGKWKGITAKL